MNCSEWYKYGLVDSPESPETPVITEITRNFTKIDKYLPKLKGTLINHVWEKSHVKTVRINFPLILNSRICSIVKNENPENQNKAFYIKKYPEFKVYWFYKTAKKRSICYLSTILAYRQISKKRCFEKCCSCDKACQSSAL